MLQALAAWQPGPTKMVGQRGERQSSKRISLTVDEFTAVPVRTNCFGAIAARLMLIALEKASKPRRRAHCYCGEGKGRIWRRLGAGDRVSLC